MTKHRLGEVPGNNETDEARKLRKALAREVARVKRLRRRVSILKNAVGIQDRMLKSADRTIEEFEIEREDREERERLEAKRRA